jgi:ketosteroid isomerase-like protein
LARDWKSLGDDARSTFPEHTVRKLILSVAVALLLPAVASTQVRPAVMSADEQSVRKFVEDYATALSSSDAAALDRLTAPDYTFVNQAGVIQNKTVRFAPIKSGQLKYQTVKYDQVQVHLFGNTAIVTTRVKVNSTNNGADASGMFRSTLTLVRSAPGSAWRLVASQATTITP